MHNDNFKVSLKDFKELKGSLQDLRQDNLDEMYKVLYQDGWSRDVLVLDHVNGAITGLISAIWHLETLLRSLEEK